MSAEQSELVAHPSKASEAVFGLAGLPQPPSHSPLLFCPHQPSDSHTIVLPLVPRDIAAGNNIWWTSDQCGNYAMVCNNCLCNIGTGVACVETSDAVEKSHWIPVPSGDLSTSASFSYLPGKVIGGVAGELNNLSTSQRTGRSKGVTAPLGQSVNATGAISVVFHDLATNSNVTAKYMVITDVDTGGELNPKLAWEVLPIGVNTRVVENISSTSLEHTAGAHITMALTGTTAAAPPLVDSHVSSLISPPAAGSNVSVHRAPLITPMAVALSDFGTLNAGPTADAMNEDDELLYEIQRLQTQLKGTFRANKSQVDALTGAVLQVRQTI